MNTDNPRTFKVKSDNSVSDAFKIKVGNLEISVVTERNGQNQVILFSESGDQISERYISDFNELVRYFWKVERLIEDQ